VAGSVKGFFYRTLFFFGWLLSPLTFWNDAFINIPLAYLCASLFIRIVPANFAFQVILFYWLSNGLGLLLMYATSRRIVKEKNLNLRSILITLLSYTVILFLIDKVIVLRPFSLFQNLP